MSHRIMRKTVLPLLLTAPLTSNSRRGRMGHAVMGTDRKIVVRELQRGGHGTNYPTEGCSNM